MTPLRPCVFLDRDGIVNEYPGPGDYVKCLGEFRLLEEFPGILRAVRDKGYEAVIVTNQRGVSLGRMTMAAVEEIHAHLRACLAGQGLHLLDILVCIDDDDASPRRKPNPGMLLEAAAKHRLDLARSWMIGDSESDIEAGRRAGCRTVLVPREAVGRTAADYRVPDLRSLRQFLLEHLDPHPAGQRGASAPRRPS